MSYADLSVEESNIYGLFPFCILVFLCVCVKEAAVGITELPTAVAAVHPQHAAGFTVHSLKGVMIIFSLFFFCMFLSIVGIYIVIFFRLHFGRIWGKKKILCLLRIGEKIWFWGQEIETLKGNVRNRIRLSKPTQKKCTYEKWTH